MTNFKKMSKDDLLTELTIVRIALRELIAAVDPQTNVSHAVVYRALKAAKEALGK